MKISERIRYANGEKPDFAIDDIGDIGHWQGMNDAALIAEAEEQVQLSKNQQVVLEWLKKKMTITDIEPIELIWRLRVNSTKEGYRDMPVYKSYRYMTKAGQFQVLAAFAEWGSKEEHS